jgi:hypothetical protein
VAYAYRHITLKQEAERALQRSVSVEHPNADLEQKVADRTSLLLTLEQLGARGAELTQVLAAEQEP